MINYEHKQLNRTLATLNAVPSDPAIFSDWITAQGHLSFLCKNAASNELIVYASGNHTFIHAVVVPNERLDPIDKDDLLTWSLNPHTSRATYATGGQKNRVWIEKGSTTTGTRTLEGATLLVFGRSFDGWSGPGRHYYELNQEYAHLTESHWRPEHRGYCRYDELGDLVSVATVTTREDGNRDGNLVTFKWEPLEEYLAAANAALVRMFDFTLLRFSSFDGWSIEREDRCLESDEMFYRQNIMPGHAGHTRGVQIIRPRRSNKEVFDRITNRWFGETHNQNVEFVAYDWRNQRVTTVSTDPTATVNYFNAKGTDLPYELSPAFFRPEVLLKYKADRDKYTVGERDISCRAAWHLRGYDVNDAGQVHAYICDLRDLPFTEQLHWLSFNERPRTMISERAFINDFKGEFADDYLMEPLTRVFTHIRRWHDEQVDWWTLRDDKLLDGVNTPLTASSDEWSESFMGLAKLIVEGFEVKVIRRRLDEAQVSYDAKGGSVVLLEKLLGSSTQTQRLSGLRTVQHLRTKLKGHVGGSEVDRIMNEALTEHETFANHFRSVCTKVCDDLEMIDEAL